MKKKTLITTLSVAVLFVILFSIFSDVVISSVKYSLQMCYASVIPSLFPFFILSEFIMSVVAGLNISGTAISFLSGLITGFPTGIKNVCTLYEKGTIDKSRATALLHCTANASPAYIVAFIGICIIKSRTAGIILLISQTVCAFAVALFFGCFKKGNHKCRYASVINLTEVACVSISNSVLSCLYVCGYIVFFGIIADIAIRIGIPQAISNIIFFLPKEQVYSVAVGIIEITRGMLSLDFTAHQSVIIASVILAFSGISVIMQCISCTIKVGLPARGIITGKLCYTLLMPCITACISKFMPVTPTHTETNTGVIPMMLFILFILFCIIFIYNIFDKRNKRLYNS